MKKRKRQLIGIAQCEINRFKSCESYFTPNFCRKLGLYVAAMMIDKGMVPLYQPERE